MYGRRESKNLFSTSSYITLFAFLLLYHLLEHGHRLNCEFLLLFHKLSPFHSAELDEREKVFFPTTFRAINMNELLAIVVEWRTWNRHKFMNLFALSVWLSAQFAHLWAANKLITQPQQRPSFKLHLVRNSHIKLNSKLLCCIMLFNCNSSNFNVLTIN